MGQHVLRPEHKGWKVIPKILRKNPNYGPKNDSLASLLSSLLFSFHFFSPLFLLFSSLYIVCFVSFVFILAPVSFLLCFFSLLSSLFSLQTFTFCCQGHQTFRCFVESTLEQYWGSITWGPIFNRTILKYFKNFQNSIVSMTGILK